MGAKLDIDLDNEKINLDGSWLTREEVASQVQKMLAAGDFKIMRHSEALEQLATAVGSAKSVTIKLTAEQFAKLESSGSRMGKSAAAFARELLMPVLDRAVAATPSQGITPVHVATVPPGSAPSGLAAATTSDVTPEEAASALTITPKKRGATKPEMAPVAVQAAATLPNLPSVVVDPNAPGPEPVGPGQTGDGRRWFNRS